jgi:mitochondrial import inner membrane translocase subunit TIM54
MPNAKGTKNLKPPNPMWKYMGLGENFRPRVPSRNWMIFLTITGTFTAAVIYDKREKRRAQRKWCKLVEHIGKEPLGRQEMPRKLTVFLEGPPSDGLRAAQDHFKEYVKPILVASGLDWDFIQGRKEGDVRAELAEKIRNSRTPPEQRTEESVVEEVRRRSGIKEFDGVRGDIVIGRHTWKEYVRGLHEGWLGPLTEPPKPSQEKTAEEINTSEKPLDSTTEQTSGISSNSTTEDDANSPTDQALPPTEPEPKPEEKPTKPPQPAPLIKTSEYQSVAIPPDLPSELGPSTPISFPHILGFLNTPRRLYRFLNRRVLADQIGRETAAIILATYRPYHSTTTPLTATSFSSDDAEESPRSKDQDTAQTAEQQTALFEEEKEWHKSARVRVEGEPERTWLEPVVLDPRISSRMRRFELTAEDEARARSIVVPEVEVEGWIKGGLRSLGKMGLQAVGLGKKEKVSRGDDEEVLE